MWRAYIVYQCGKCGHEIRSRDKIYKFDEDDFHYRAFDQSPGQKEILMEVQRRSCPVCSGEMEFKGWTE